jgi:shikimate kinase
VGNKKDKRIALTGFMGVGKSSVARHLAHALGCERTDLDNIIEENEGRTIADIIHTDGEARYREIETDNLKRVISDKNVRILSLGGGAWTVERNREVIKNSGFTSVWLESSFEHCWMNIKFSHKVRPLAKNKRSARKLFDERQKVYCLADWHFIVKPGLTSFDVASHILEELFS